MKTHSLRAQLLKKLILPIVLAMVAIAGAGYYSAREEIGEVYDSELITAANVLWLLNRDYKVDHPTIQMGTQSIDLDDMDPSALDEYAQWRSFRVIKNGKILIESDNARPASEPPGPEGFTSFRTDGEKWRSYTLHVPEEHTVVEVAERIEARSDLILRISEGLLWPLMLVLPVIGVLIWRGVHLGLVDLRRFTIAIKKRSPNDLSRLSAEYVPVELTPLAEGLNQLLGKLEAAAEHERVFMDNAAHELRTPLAALSIQAQVALSATSEAERMATLEDLAGGVSRAARLVDQMLLLSRLKYQLKAFQTLNVSKSLRNVIKEYVPLALQKRIELTLKGDEAAVILTQEDLLHTMIGNLLDNAIKYTPEGGRIRVKVAFVEGRVEISISDTGPGIPESEHDRVFDRFYRSEEHLAPGSGLGLAIVKHIADLLQVEIALKSREKATGLSVRLYFNTVETI